ncbi:MAG: hypothetical protein QXO21_05145 [Candidatus Anstonellales archaeon]
MGKLGIFDEEKTKWIQFDEDTEVLLKFVSKEELKKISIKAERASRLSGVDPSDVANIQLGRTAVLGWRKIDNHNHPGLIVKGQPFPYTKENVDLLMTKSLEFSKFVNENAINSRIFLEEEEEEEKNA